MTTVQNAVVGED